MGHIVEGGRVVLFMSWWGIAYEDRYVTHPLIITYYDEVVKI